MKRLAITGKSKPAARGLWEEVGGNVGGTPTVTFLTLNQHLTGLGRFGATSLSEGGQGQRQNQNQAQGSVIDRVLDLLLPPSPREGAAQQPGGSCTHPVAPLPPRDISLLVLP
jgi:hypothetical protein